MRNSACHDRVRHRVDVLKGREWQASGRTHGHDPAPGKPLVLMAADADARVEVVGVRSNRVYLPSPHPVRSGWVEAARDRPSHMPTKQTRTQVLAGAAATVPR
jgi:hypothetical protein